MTETTIAELHAKTSAFWDSFSMYDADTNLECSQPKKRQRAKPNPGITSEETQQSSDANTDHDNVDHDNTDHDNVDHDNASSDNNSGDESSDSGYDMETEDSEETIEFRNEFESYEALKQAEEEARGRIENRKRENDEIRALVRSIVAEELLILYRYIHESECYENKRWSIERINGKVRELKMVLHAQFRIRLDPGLLKIFAKRVLRDRKDLIPDLINKLLN